MRLCYNEKALSHHLVDFWRKNTVKYCVCLLGYRPQGVCALTKHLSFLYVSRQVAEKMSAKINHSL